MSLDWAPRRRSLGLTGALASLLVACGAQGKKQPERPAADAQPVDTLSSSLLTDTAAFGQVFSLANLGPWLVAIDAKGPPHLHVIEWSSGVVERSLGREGNGPGDFAGAPSFLPSSRANRLWLKSGGLSGTPIRLTALDPNSVKRPFAAVHLGPESSRALVVLPDGDLFGTAMFEDRPGSFVRYPEKGDQRIIAPLHDSLPGVARADFAAAFDHALCVSPNGDRIAVVYKYAGITIVDTTGSVIVEAKVPYPGSPTLGKNPKTGRDTFLSGMSGAGIRYIGCAATERFLYTLFLGARRQKINGKYWVAPEVHSQLHIFGWDGRLVRVVQLDHQGFAPAVDPADSLLFTIPESDSLPSQILVTKLR